MKLRHPLFSSQGGIHPHYHKQSTADQPIEFIPLPEKLYVSMSQHLGAPAKPVVKKGDSVLRGQIIGEQSGFVSAPVHAPTSGKVSALSDKPALSGLSVPVIEIEPDGEDQRHSAIKPNSDWKSLDSKKLVDLIANAGIVGMGGAGFPTYIKLSPPANKTIDTLIINGAECEPFLTSDQRLMEENPDKVLAGVEIIRKILGVNKVIVAIEDNKPDAIHIMEQAENKAELVVLKTRYPQGAEKQLIYTITGREVPSGGLPMDVGVLVQNVGTCAAIYDAVVQGCPLIERIVTVTGDLVENPKNLRVRIGTAFSDMIKFCGGICMETADQSGAIGKLICGGPMMGLAQSSLETGLTKTTSGIMLMPQDQVEQFTSTPCISCGRCIPSCPMGLMPCLLSDMIEAKDYEAADAANVLDCIECGCCAFECPARRPLVQHMKKAKAEITARRKQK